MQSFDLASIGILGTAIALVVEGIKVRYGTTSLATKLIVASLALVIGTVFVLFSGAAWWATVIGILGVSQTIYALFIK